MLKVRPTSLIIGVKEWFTLVGADEGGYRGREDDRALRLVPTVTTMGLVVFESFPQNAEAASRLSSR